MYKVSYHNHSDFSDGKNSMSEMAAEAYAAGFTHYAFTDHNHIPGQEGWTVSKNMAADYLAEIEKLKNLYDGKMKIYSGIEKDWFYKQGEEEIFTPEQRKRLDIVIGSVHQLKGSKTFDFIDGDPFTYDCVFKEQFDSDPHAFVYEYFASMEEMIINMRPTLVAHPDIIRIHNASGKYFSEKDPYYYDLIEKLARTMKKYGCVSEINGGGDFRHHNGVFYPSDDLLNIFRETGIPLTIGLDAHSTQMLTAYYDKSLTMLKNAGYKEISVFENGSWQSINIKEFQ